LLGAVALSLPPNSRVILLADRIPTGEPFLPCLDALGWAYIFRATADTLVETAPGWTPLQRLSCRSNQGRFLSQVRIWKGSRRRTNVRCYKLARKGFRSVT
jgi:hypothetical protein